MRRPSLNPNGIPVIWWIGTSTRHQKHSPLIQFDWCWKTSYENGFFPIAILRVPGHSRSYIFYQDAARDIPAYQKLLDIFRGQKSVKPKMLLTMARDRLGRNALATQVEALCDENKCQIWSGRTGQPIDGSVGQIFASGMELTMSRAETYQTQERRRGAVLRRVKEKKLPYGKPEYGYKTVRDERGKSIGVDVHPETSKTRQLIDELFIAGNSPVFIARMLQNRFENGDEICKPPAKNQWHANIVRKLLKSRFPLGEYKAKISGESISVIGNHPRLRTDEQQIEIDRQFSRRASGTQRGNTSIARYYGIAYCADCGGKMIRCHPATTATNKGIDYGCSTYRYSVRTTKLVCSTHYTYESMMTEAIARFFQQPVDQALISLQSKLPLDRSQELVNARQRLQVISRKKVEAIKLQLDTGLAHDAFAQVIGELEQQEKDINAEIKELERNQSKIPNFDHIKDWLEEMLSIPNLQDWLENDEPDVIRSVLAGRIRVKCYQRKYKSLEPSPIVELIV
jgi:DNA invertase Pin-like site-specific DNA recombinase